MHLRIVPLQAGRLGGWGLEHSLPELWVAPVHGPADLLMRAQAEKQAPDVNSKVGPGETG